MSLTRLLAAGLVAAGAALGSLVDTGGPTEPRRAGAYFVVAADFHVHAFPGDGSLPPWEIAREAGRRGLHAVVVSNHNQTRAPRFGAWLRREGLPLLIPAQEITTPAFHIVGVGVTSTIDWRLPGADIIRAVQAQGGVAIAAHPVRASWKGSDEMLALLDGAEVAHPLTALRVTGRSDLTAFFMRARTINPDIAPIGSSDFHMIHPLAACRTYVFAESVTVAGVLDAVRAGRTVAQDQDGVLYGAPALTLLLDPLDLSHGAQGRRSLRLLSIGLAFAGMLMLLVRR
ncbi:MAG: CehA/McbA family metallohydrolase [Acidobacteriota bacterium]|nr:CehA/McbA family metallohydrolase [Acidobacteriota bacterium]